MPGAWMMNSGGRIYGPFTSERMREFAVQGRLAPFSMVARKGKTDWHEAQSEPELAELLKADAAGATAPVPHPAAPQAAVAGITDTVGENGAANDGELSHFAILIERKSHGTGQLDDTILSLGPAYKLLPNVWLLTTGYSANAVRNRIVREISKHDSVFVIDASRGKAAWFNFGPEIDAQIRRVWRKAS